MPILLDDFAVRALFVGLGVVLVTGPLGVFVVWRRLSYFGAALSHAALLGVALGFLLGLDPLIGVAVMCVLVALMLVALKRGGGRARATLASDTLLGIIAHGALAAGLIATSFLQGVRLDLMGYLFGDILAVSNADVLFIYGGAAVVLGLLGMFWRPLVAVSVQDELAFVEGVNVRGMEILLMLMLALTVALAMKVVGILLVTSLLIIPAAAARRFASSPEGMALLAVVAGVISVVGGMGAAFSADLPAGPAIVMAAVGVFLLSRLGLSRRRSA